MSKNKNATRADHQVIVVGAGFSGLCMAIQLKEAGYDDFVVLEKAADIGGTWRDNIYRAAPAMCPPICTPTPLPPTRAGRGCLPLSRKSGIT